MVTNACLNSRLPGFIIGGAQKGGTTWLARNIAGHPDIYMPKREVHFFDIDENYKKGITWYAEHFADAGKNQSIGEKTPDYLTIFRSQGQMPIAERIFSKLPNVKILIVLRDPVERALSSLRHHMYFRRFTPSAAIDDILFGRWRDQCEHWNILSGGQYAKNLKHYMALFGQENIRIWIFEEDIIGRPQDTLDEVYQFLGAPVNKHVYEPARAANVGLKNRASFIFNHYFPSLSPVWQTLDPVWPQRWEVRANERCMARLYEYYQNDNEELFTLLGRRIEHWREGRSLLQGNARHA